MRIKKWAAVVLAAGMMLSSVPMAAMAQDTGSGLETAIRAVKAQFQIPDELDQFSSHLNSEGGEMLYNLSWSSKSNQGGNISATATEKGRIISFSKYTPGEYGKTRYLPKISRTEAVARAEKFLNEVNTETNYTWKALADNAGSSLTDPSYNVQLQLQFQGVPVSGASASVQVNRQNGEISGFWSPVTHGKPGDEKNTLDAKSAADAWKTGIGMNVIYQPFYTESGITVRQVYVPVSQDVISAVTGKPVKITGYYGPMYSGAAAYDMKESVSKNVLTDAERKAVESAAKVLSAKEAEQKARAFAPAGLDSTMVLVSQNLSYQYPLKDKYLWYLSFSNGNGTKGDVTRWATVTLDAETGKLVTFSSNDTTVTSEGKTLMTAEAARKVAEDFVAAWYPERTGIKAVPGTLPEKAEQYSFQWTRTVNGISFPANGVQITVDRRTGKVTYSGGEWYDMMFAQVQPAITAAQAADTYLGQAGMSMVWRSVDSTDASMSGLLSSKMIYPPAGGNGPLSLVWQPGDQVPAIVDALSGNLMDAQGNPWKPAAPVTVYTDLDGHFAKDKINLLAELGMGLPGTQFQPEKSMLQKEFFTMLVRSLDYWSGNATGDKAQDDMYQYLKSRGVVLAGEIKPDATLTRADAVRFLIRALGYQAVADIPGIYQVSFTDSRSIPADMTGYVAIAAGLKIINGYSDGRFAGSDTLNRGQAAAMIYNYLSVPR